MSDRGDPGGRWTRARARDDDRPGHQAAPGPGAGVKTVGVSLTARWVCRCPRKRPIVMKPGQLLVLCGRCQGVRPATRRSKGLIGLAS